MAQNFATSLLTNAPGTSGTSVTVTTGTGSRFINGLATVGPDATTWTPANAEVVTITNVSSDALTVTRQSESSTAMALAAGYRIVQGVTAGMYDALVTADAARLVAASNLSDLANAATARTNLGLGTAATQASTAFDAAGAATAAQAASLQKSANLSDLANASTARTNLGLGDAAVLSTDAIVTSVAGRTGDVTIGSSDIAGLFLGGVVDTIQMDEGSTIPAAHFQFDADSISPQTDGAAVSSWVDDAGGAALVQATGANQPTLKTGIINGHSVVRFVTNDWLSRTVSMTASTSYTLVLVGKPNGTPGTYPLIGGKLHDYNATVKGGTGVSAASSMPGWMILRLTISSTGFTLYRNGSPVMGGTTNLGDLTTMYLGQDGTGTFFAGWDIAHVRGYNVVTTPEEGQAIDLALSRRYGIKVASGFTSVRQRTDGTLGSRAISVTTPETLIAGAPTPLVIFCHGGGGSPTSAYGWNGNPGATTDAALALGCAVAGIALGNLANQSDLTAISDLVTHVRTTAAINVSKIIMLGQSLGGLPSLSTISRGVLDGTGIPVLGALLIYPVIDMRAYPGAGGGSATITAYGLTNGTTTASLSIGATSISSTVSYPVGTVLQIDSSTSYELVTVTGSPSGSGPYTIPVTALTKSHASGTLVSDYGTKVEVAGFNPMTRDVSTYATKRFRLYGSPADTVVHFSDNVTPFAAANAATAREVSVVTTRGAHGDQSNFPIRDGANFLLRCLNDQGIT